MTQLWRRWRQLSRDDRYALACSALLLTQATLLLRLRAIDKARRSAERTARWFRIKASLESIGWAVDRAAAHLPWHPSCLPVAVAGAALLKAAGHDCTFCIGARTDEAQPAFHAWVSVNGIVLLGATDQPHALLYARP